MNDEKWKTKQYNFNLFIKRKHKSKQINTIYLQEKSTKKSISVKIPN